MSHISSMFAAERYHRRARRVSKPHDGMTKDQLWAQLQAAKEALRKAADAAQRCATAAHNHAQDGLQGTVSRRRMLELRDCAYEIRDAAQSAGGAA